MRVTNVKLRILDSASVLAYADVEFDGVLTSKGWRVFQGRDGRDYDLGLPSEMDRKGTKDQKTGETKWWPTIWIDPRTDDGKKLWDHIKDVVFTKYATETTSPKSSGSKPKAADKGRSQYGDDDIPF